MISTRNRLILSSCALAVSCGGESPEAVPPDNGAGGNTASTQTEAPAAQGTTGADESGASSRGYAVRDLPDPAMERGAAATGVSGEGEIASDSSQEETGEQGEPDGFTVDAENGRVFIPGRGWITAEDFWEIYYKRPQELPGGIEHEALNAIRPESG